MPSVSRLLSLSLYSADLDGGEDLGSLVDTVTRRAQAIASRAYARRKVFHKSMTHPHSRSHGNLVELEEGDEDEFHRKNRLKFPSDYAIDTSDADYYQLLGNKEEVMRTLRGLARSGCKVGKNKRDVAGGGEADGEVKGDLESSLSEPDLHRGKWRSLL